MPKKARITIDLTDHPDVVARLHKDAAIAMRSIAAQVKFEFLGKSRKKTSAGNAALYDPKQVAFTSAL
jgi:hypothetical protein